jgi:hypothetical protein
MTPLYHYHSHDTTAFRTDLLRKVPVLAVDVVWGHFTAACDGELRALHGDPVCAPSYAVTLCSYMQFHHLPPILHILTLYDMPLSLKACRVLQG